MDVSAPDDFGEASTTLTRERAGAMVIFADGMLGLHQARMVDLVVKSRLPAMGTTPMVGAGALMSYEARSVAPRQSPETVSRPPRVAVPR